LLIFAGNDELLRDDSVRFAHKAQEAGVPVRLQVGEGMFHRYPVCAPLFPEATAAMQELAAFIKAPAQAGAESQKSSLRIATFLYISNYKNSFLQPVFRYSHESNCR